MMVHCQDCGRELSDFEHQKHGNLCSSCFKEQEFEHKFRENKRDINKLLTG